MKKITKREEPNSLTRWKQAHPGGNYKEIDDALRKDIREACSKEQFFLCAYCCTGISGKSTDTMNEHVQARREAPNRSLDFQNIVASCKTLGQCDSAHGSQPLPITPLMDECEKEFKFKISGRVEGITERAREAIAVLNLGDSEQNNKSLIAKRKALSESLLWVNGVDPSEGLEDDDLLQAVIDDLLVPDDGALRPFSPVVANILRGWMLY